MAIIRTYHKSKKRKPSEAERKLRADWERILAAHSKPLEQGSKSKGKLPGITKVVAPKPKQFVHRETEHYPSLPMQGYVGKPAVDPIAPEKEALKTRVGQVYPKGAPQYLIDSDLAEQKTGAHRRRN